MLEKAEPIRNLRYIAPKFRRGKGQEGVWQGEGLKMNLPCASACDYVSSSMWLLCNLCIKLYSYLAFSESFFLLRAADAYAPHVNYLICSTTFLLCINMSCFIQ